MWAIVLSIFVVTFALVHGKPKLDYCSMPKCKTAHLACNETYGIMSPDCPGLAEIVNLHDYRDFIVNYHNKIRNYVAGKERVPRMATMSWDNELDYFASLIAAQCDIFTEKCRRTERFVHPGLNAVIYSFSGDGLYVFPEKIIAKRLKKWANEYKHVTNKTFFQHYVPSNKLNVTVSHYALMVAEGNPKIGCSAVDFDDGEQLSNFIFICVYAITNRAGRPVYTTAKRAASQCKTGPSSTYRHLCSTNERYQT